jgi:hypothetical protein
MNAVVFQQTANHLSRQTRRWDRRWRLVMSLIWLPRGAIAGLLFGITLGLMSRLRPWLLPNQIAVGAMLAVILGALGILGVVWGWPRSVARNARFFDYQFDLKERVSTALELSRGMIPVPEPLAEYQLNDAVLAARGVDVGARLPFQVRFWELASVFALAALLIYMLIADNPMSDKVRQQRELDAAINEQIQDLEQAIEDIEANDALTPEEQAALSEPLEEAMNIMNQSDVSQQEAVAAMAEASDRLDDMSDGMSSEDEAAYQNSARDLNQSQMTSDLAQAFQQPDLGEAGDAMDEMADQMGEEELSQDQRDDLAERLEQTADEIQETNPALAEKMRETADALREGDMEAAQEAAREAGELMRQQDEALENSPQAEAARDAQGQVDESQRDLAQAGWDALQPENTEEAQGEPQAQQQGSSQTGEQQNAESQQSDEDGAQSPLGQGESQQGGETAAGEPTVGQEQSGEMGSAGPQPGEGGEGQSESSDDGGGGFEAGTGEGGAGTDNTEGVTNQGEPGESTGDNSEGGGIEEFQPEFAPSTIGGQSDDVVDVTSDQPAADSEGETVGEGEFGPNPQGESTLSYTGVYNEYRDIVSDALESGRIPLDQRDVIHDYFSSLDQ